MHHSRILRSKIGRTLIKAELGTEIKVVERTPCMSFPYCDRKVIVKGTLASLELPIFPFIKLEATRSSSHQTVSIKVANENEGHQKAMWGTTRAHIGRMVIGVQDGYTLPLKMVGVGYRALLEKGDDTNQQILSLKIGVSHPVLLPVPIGIKVLLPAPQHIILTGSDWPLITQFAAQIRAWRKPEPYNQKGIFVGDETIMKKEGKKR